MAENLYSDIPLQYPSDDKLGYARFAEALAQSIVHMSPEDGFVMALFGEWGAGKSTVVNFVQYYISQYESDEQPIVISFNPWWFTNTNDLILVFFSQMLNKLKQRHLGYQLNKVADKMKGFVNILSSLPGGEVAGLASAGLELFSKTDIVALKENIAERLRERKKKILVIVDDIDRLSRDEMLQVFTIIKAIANFPYVTYFLAFDKQIVAENLGNSGDSYLEKIIQASFELPLPSTQGMIELFVSQLETIVGPLPKRMYSEGFLGHQGDVFNLIKFMSTPRKIMRFINSLRITYIGVQNEVFIRDFVFMEFLRLYFSEAYIEIRRNKRLLTAGGSMTEEERANLPEILTDQPKEILEMIESLFPDFHSQNALWNRTSVYERSALRMVSDPLSFDTYFRYGISDDRVSIREINALIAATNNQSELINEFKKYAYQPVSRAIDLIRSLALRTKTISSDASVKFINAMFEVGDEFLNLPSSGFWGEHPHDLLIGLNEQFLENLPSEDRFDQLVKSLESGRADFLKLRLIVSLRLEHGLGDERQRKRPEIRVLQTSEAEQLGIISLRLIRKVTALKEFFDVPSWNTVLHLWVDLEPDGTANWLRDRLKLASDLIRFLQEFASFEMSNPEDYTWISPSIELYLSMDELMEIAKSTFSEAHLDTAQWTIAENLVTALEKSLNAKNQSKHND